MCAGTIWDQTYLYKKLLVAHAYCVLAETIWGQTCLYKELLVAHALCVLYPFGIQPTFTRTIKSTCALCVWTIWDQTYLFKELLVSYVHCVLEPFGIKPTFTKNYSLHMCSVCWNHLGSNLPLQRTIGSTYALCAGTIWDQTYLYKELLVAHAHCVLEPFGIKPTFTKNYW